MNCRNAFRVLTACFSAAFVAVIAIKMSIIEKASPLNLMGKGKCFAFLAIYFGLNPSCIHAPSFLVI
jgi:hypothetical protein